MVLKGLVSVSISLNVFVMYTWTTVGFLPNRGLKGLVYLFEIYTKNIIILFFAYEVLVKLVPLCSQYLHVMLYQMKLIKLSLKRGFYLSTSVLLFYLCLDQTNNQIPCKIKPKHKEVPHPLPSDLNSTVNADFEAKLRLHSYIRLQLASEWCFIRLMS